MTANDRMLSVLTLFSVEQNEWTVEQAGQHLGISLSQTYRYFASLTGSGLIAPTRGGRYVVGPAALQLDWLARQTDPLNSAANEPLRALANHLDMPAVLMICRRYRDVVICSHQLAVNEPHFRSGYERGRPMPLFRGASSKSILANLPLRTLKSTFAQHSKTVGELNLGTDWDQFRRNMAAIRRAGFSVSYGEVDEGLAGLAVPLFDPDRLLLGSLSIVTQQASIGGKPTEETVDMLHIAANNIRDKIV